MITAQPLRNFGSTVLPLERPVPRVLESQEAMLQKHAGARMQEVNRPLVPENTQMADNAPDEAATVSAGDAGPTSPDLVQQLHAMAVRVALVESRLQTQELHSYDRPPDYSPRIPL
jgi:hypothetical protein